jgi:hypothetical protein
VNFLRQLALVAVVGLALAAATPVNGFEPYHGHRASRADVIGRYYAAQRPWHGPYAYTQWGKPVSLVVPPNSKMHTSYSWGVAQTEMVPIYHQFHRDYPGPLGLGGAPIYSTPYWPSHTDQLGVYPVRGPW